MDCWFCRGFAHGAAICGLCRIGGHAVGHRPVCRFVACLGRRDVGRHPAFVDRTHRLNLRVDQCHAHGHGRAWFAFVGGHGHLAGANGRLPSVAHGRFQKWLAVEFNQLTRDDGLYTSSRPLNHCLTTASSDRVARWHGI